MEVAEGGPALLVNLRDYLDTGLFLDHRPLSAAASAAEARGKRFLNLFCYTAAATVHAAAAARAAPPAWTCPRPTSTGPRRNLALQRLRRRRARLVRADCLRWLGAERADRCDLVFLDPPTVLELQAHGRTWTCSATTCACCSCAASASRPAA